MTASAKPNSQEGQLKPNNRLGNKKTKTGCLTCKARKVKCDEGKPACKRCINADRTCRGYIDVFVSTHADSSRDSLHEIWSFTPPSSRSSSGSPPRSPSPSLSTVELRALQYYQVEVSKLLGGSIEPSFWTKSVLQLSEHEPAVKQALMAISTEWESKLHTDVFDRHEARRVSMIAYNKALKQTTERLNQPNADSVALATCVLFLCLHCLQGDKLQAAKFLQTGSGVMLKVLQGPNAVSDNPESLKSMFLPIFERLVVLLRLFGVCLPSFRTTELVLYNADGTFRQLHTLDEARNILYWLVAESHELIVKTRPHRFGRTAEPLDLKAYTQKQEEQLAAYRSWLEEFERLCKPHPSFASEHRHYISLLRLVHGVTAFWLSTCLDQYEALCDNYNHYFRLIIENAEVVTEHDGPLPFTFEMGVIPPLYLVILKCREPSLRQQALDLLGRAPEREGLWRREEVYRVAKRVYDLESKDFEILSDGTVFQDARVCDVQTRYSDETGTHITIAAKLYGSSQVWKIWDEVLPCEEISYSDWSGGF